MTGQAANASKARRVTIFEAEDGWRYRVQSTNWRLIELTPVGLRTEAAARRRAARRFPNVEIVVEGAS